MELKVNPRSLKFLFSDKFDYFQNFIIYLRFEVHIMDLILQDIVNYDTFMGLLSDEEQQQLVEHVSPVDADLEG